MTKYKHAQLFLSRILIIALTLTTAAWLLPSTRAQEPSPTASPTASPTSTVDKAALHQALVDLTKLWTVMCVAAHPDDEDGTTLTVLRRRDGVHTVSLFSTYGEGGQNAVGPELYEELGVIREQETRAAAKIQGSEPYFLGLKDFGFSKSAEEAFKVWGHDEALRRMVLKIRELRPDVIITNHDTTSGHGHHQATGRLIIEAFDAAADPERFPEQLSQVQPWQAQRLFVRIFGANAKIEASDKVFSIDPNEVDPVRGTSYAEQALTALQQHATQGPWPKSMAEMLRARRIETGKLPFIRYRLVREAAGAASFANANTPLAGLSLPEVLTAKLAPPAIEDKPLTNFLDRPDRVLAALIDWRATASRASMNDNGGAETFTELAAKDAVRINLFQDRLDRALAIASGVSMTLSSQSPVLVPGVSSSFSLELANSGLSNVKVEDLRFEGWGTTTPLTTAEELLPDTETNLTIDRLTPANSKLTVPREEHLYDATREQTFHAVAELEMDGAKFSVSAALARDVAPAVEIKKISPSPCVRTEEMLGNCRAFEVVLANNVAAPFRGILQLDNLQSGHSAAVKHQLVMSPKETRTDRVLFSNSRSDRGALRELRSSGEMQFSIRALNSAGPITKRLVPIVYSAARVVPNLKVGYVPSFDETLKNSLVSLGVDAKELSIADVQSGNLSSYATIIIDNRGYEAHHELIAANPRLLEFANNGGTLIVFYHKDNEWNPDEKKGRPQLAPFQIVLDDKRVTDETVAITFLQPKHPLLVSPNAITQADFANWIQERGLYYPKQWDDHFTALFSSHDPGEAALTGGLLVAPYGKGQYIYTSMVWYRELRAGVPGAYRMLANMVSYGHR
jgi:LmbE family N-acetylglucosaminyl deacetylase